jgi:RNA polymerase sigma-70 factor (ECF subfamily)
MRATLPEGHRAVKKSHGGGGRFLIPWSSFPSSDRAIDDRELIQRIVSGERDVYAELVRRYQEKVFRLCTSLLADATEAEDAAQEIFLKAYRSLSRFRGASSFSTWLYRIAANHCRDLLRSRARHAAQSWDALVEQEGERIDRLLVAPPDPGRKAEEADLVRRVLEQLSSEHRMILILREIEGLSYDELAQVLECSLEAVRGRLSRAREDFERKLRHIVKGGNV